MFKTSMVPKMIHNKNMITTKAKKKVNRQKSKRPRSEINKYKSKKLETKEDGITLITTRQKKRW